jgi:hypothetical protein
MPGTFAVLAAALPVWLGGVAVYNIYFHPLAKVPGPKLAAVTSLYKTYFNATNGSKFYIQIQKLHEEFGESTPSAPAGHFTDISTRPRRSNKPKRDPSQRSRQL